MYEFTLPTLLIRISTLTIIGTSGGPQNDLSSNFAAVGVENPSFDWQAAATAQGYKLWFASRYTVLAIFKIDDGEKCEKANEMSRVNSTKS